MTAAAEKLQQGQRVRVDAPGVPEFATVRFVAPTDADGVTALFLADDAGATHEVHIGPGQIGRIRALISDGSGASARVLSGMWTRWMAAAASNADSSAIASTQLRPYAHQTTAVYGAMLPQPLLRFLLADEPGTGKTIMAGLYLREMQRLGVGAARHCGVPRKPRVEVGGRLQALLRWRPAPLDRQHDPRGCGRLAQPVGCLARARSRQSGGAGGNSPRPRRVGSRGVRRGAPPDPNGGFVSSGWPALGEEHPPCALDDRYPAPWEGVVVPAPAAPGRSGGVPRSRRRHERLASTAASRSNPLPPPDEGGPRRLRRQDPAVQGTARQELRRPLVGLGVRLLPGCPGHGRQVLSTDGSAIGAHGVREACRVNARGTGQDPPASP